MNVIRATLNKTYKSRGKRGRFRNGPIFNTYHPRATGDHTSSKSLLSSSDFSLVQPSVPNPGKVLGTAERNSCSSHSTEPVLRTPNVAASLQTRTTSKEPQITNEFLAEAFRTPDVPATTNSSNSKISSHHRQLLRSLPPPISVRKPRSSTSSGARPLSTISHTRTPRTPKTPSTADSSQHIIVAITEGRGLARGEVGLAAMDIYRPHLVLCQISDSQTYINTLTKVNIIQPAEILVPNTFVDGQQESKLFSLLHDTFPQVSITTVQRRHFSDNVGLQQIQSLCLPEYASVELVLSHKFYALAAAAALLKFTEFMKNIIFTSKSLRIEYQSPENVMAIDMGTAQRLELVMCRGGEEVRGSLLGILDHCCTVSGKRSLRANILQPPTSLDTIDSRLLSVTELSQSPAFLHSLQTAVSKFTDVEQLLWLCVQVPNFKDEQKASEMQTNYVLLLKTSLDSLPMLRDCLQTAQTPYFHKVLKDLDDERFGQLLTTILEVVNTDARSKKGYSASQFQRCFAIKTGINGLLDMARSSYSDLVSNMHEKVQQMAEEFSLPLRASTTGNKGLHIQLSINKNSAFSAKDLPPVFIQVSRTRNLITCTTEELVVLNHRMKQVLQEIQVMSNLILLELLRKLRVHMGCLYRLCENIAELDLLVSFAQVSSANSFVQPTFGTKMELKGSRHPILDFINPSTPVDNDVFASTEKNFHIITGPNMGGKSIYIKQVALLQVMAQIGCFVPAESAEFRITKQIFSRMGFDDSIEYNASSFVLEIQEMQYILRSLRSDCLVVIDELCRSTDYEEGTALAWVLCEQLLQSKAFTFFTTHFLYLTKLQNLYPNVTNHQMLAEESAEGRLTYTHKLAPGVTSIVYYGLSLAQVSALPATILQRAKEICTSLAQQKLAEPVYSSNKTEAEKDQEYIQELLDLIQSNRFNLNEVKNVQAKLKKRFSVETTVVQETAAVESRDCDESSEDEVMNGDVSRFPNQRANHSVDNAAEFTFQVLNVPSTSKSSQLTVDVLKNSPLPKGQLLSCQKHTSTLRTKKIESRTSLSEILPSQGEKGNSSKRSEIKQYSNSRFEVSNSPFYNMPKNVLSPNLQRSPETPVRRRSVTSYSQRRSFEGVSVQNPPKVANPHTPSNRVECSLSSKENPSDFVNQQSLLNHKDKDYSAMIIPSMEPNQRSFVENSHQSTRGSPVVLNTTPLVRQRFSQTLKRNSPGTLSQHSNLEINDDIHLRSFSSRHAPFAANSPQNNTGTSTPHTFNPDFVRSAAISPVLSLLQEPNNNSSNRFLTGTSEPWQNYERGTQMSDNIHYNSHSPLAFERPSSLSPHLFESPNQNQRSTVSSTPMVLDLFPNFERIPRNIGSDSVFHEDVFEE